GLHRQRLVARSGARGSQSAWLDEDVSRPSEFPPREARLVARLRTPLAVQRYLNALPYNQEPGGRATLRSFRGVVRHGCAHCLAAALFAAVLLAPPRSPPTLLRCACADE